MKVVYVVSRYPAVSHTFIDREIAALREQGVDVVAVSVLYQASPTDPDGMEARRTIKLRPIHPLHLVAVLLRVSARSPRAFVKTYVEAWRGAPVGLRGRLWSIFHATEAMLLVEVLDAERADHVHAHFANVAADLALLAAYFMRARGHGRRITWSFTMHGPTEFHDERHFRLAHKARQADFVVAVSEFCRSQLLRLMPTDSWDKVHVVHCGVDPQFFDTAESRSPASADILCVGRLVPDKGQSVLVDAVALLKEEFPVLRLILVGDGPARETLAADVERKGLSPNVEMLGWQDQCQIRELYRRATVFCLPSFAEGLPVVLMEAMAMALPVVTTPIAGVPELVVDGVDGILVPPGNSTLLADGLRRVLTDPELRDRCAKNGQAVVLREFVAYEQAERLRALFEQTTAVPTVARRSPRPAR